MPSYGDLVWCMQAPGECPPYVGWSVRLVMLCAAVLVGIAIGWALHVAARRRVR